MGSRLEHRIEHIEGATRSKRSRIRSRAVKATGVTKKVVLASGSKAKNVSKKIAKNARKASVVGAKKGAQTLVVIHFHTIKRPHVYMQSNWGWYARWHAWPKHRVVHYISLSSYLLVVGLVLFSSVRTVLAADLSNNWDFSTPSDFSFDSGVEANGGSARLKAQEYSSDADTSALYHMNESSGTSITDSSANNNDATSTGSPTFGNGVMNNALNLNGSSQSAVAPDSASLSVTGQQSVEAWVKPNTAFDNNSSQSQTILDKGSYKLGLDRTSGKATYEIQNENSNQWTKRLGDGQANSWDFNHGSIESSVGYGSDVYVGLGSARGDAEVWKWNGTTWSKVGGDGIRSSWADLTYEAVYSMAVNGTALYAGLGNTSGDGEVWGCELSTGCTSWSKLGGDGTGIASGMTVIPSMVVHAGSLYVGTQSGAGSGDVYKYNGGTSWTQIGGDGLNSGWLAATYETVASLASDGTTLYAGIGSTTGDGEIWGYNGTTWLKLGGDGLSSSWNTSYETVESIAVFGGNLYAGLGNGNQDAEVWRLSGGIWSQIGGDGLNSGWTANNSYTQVQYLEVNGSDMYAGVGAGTNGGMLWKYNGSTWTQVGGSGVNSSWTSHYVNTFVFANSKIYAGVSGPSGAPTHPGGSVWEYDGTTWQTIGGLYLNNSWGGYNVSSVYSSTTYNGKLYYGLGGGVSSAMVYEYDGTTANIIGGNGIKNSWPIWTYESVNAMTTYKGELYVGLGTGSGDAEVWKYNGSTWSKVGGDGLNSGWASGSIVNAMAVWRGDLYASIANILYRYNGSTWSLVTSSWSPSTYVMYSIIPYGDRLCIGGGGNGSYSNVFCWTGTGGWTHVGGNGANGSWSAVTNGFVGLTAVNGILYASEVNNNGNQTVWAYDNSSWTQVGGDGLNGSWSTGGYSWTGLAPSMTVYNGELYIGTAGSATAGETWKYDGSSWVKVAGSGTNNSWSVAQSIEAVTTLTVYKGKMYAGLGTTGNADALVYSYGNNGYVESSISSFSADWNHIAATYDGIRMKIFINGVQDASVLVSTTGVDGVLPLLIGAGYGGSQPDGSQPFFEGSIDEVRISNNTRGSFTSKPYSTTPQAVRLNESIRKSGVESWDGLSSSETTNGGTISYRLSDDDGATWKYWDGSAWSASVSYTDSNVIAIVNTNIGTFPVTFDGITWQAVLSGDGTQQVTLNSVTLSANSDTFAPDTNATNISGNKSNGGASLASNAWTNGSSPYFSWDAATDAGAGISGYCLYLGQTSSSDPETAKGLLGTSPLDTNSRCPFAVSSTNLDLATSGYLATALVSSDDPYYLNIKAIDGAGNLYGLSEQFQFRFDNTLPDNPGFISAPSGFINTKSATITWPTVGGQAASDDNSGLLGLQYKFNNGSWYGDSHIGTGDSSDLLANDGSYTTTDPSAPDSTDIVDGVNTIYIRTWDNAGNVTNTYTTAALKVNTSGAPTEPQNVVATPSTNTANSFAFSWAAPTTFVGNGNNITYCYTINTLPTISNCSFTSAGDTDLAADAYATQPGANTFYVVAKDESGNINYSSFSSVSFTANTPAPSLPLNMDIVDVSIKSTNNWRLAVTWDEPSVVGAGISAYRIYRSADSTNFSLVGSSSSPSFVDSGLSQQIYYYKIRACDSANNCSADSATVSLLPTGKFTEPAELVSPPSVSDITTKRATVSWSTNRESDSKIAIGTSSGQYSPSEISNSDQVTSHVVNLDNLEAGRTYFLVARWTDGDGNTGVSDEISFQTAPAPVLKEVNTLRVGLSTSIIQFTSKDAAKVDVQFGSNENFGGIKSLNTSVKESKYEVELNGLSDGVKYLYRITMYDSEGGEYRSSIFTFTTPSRPRISNLRFQPIAGEPTSTQQVTWTTNVPTNTLVTYGKENTSGLDVQTPELKTEHQLIIRNLEDDSQYFLLAQGRDAGGNLVVSDKQLFRTALDTRAPKISDITIEPNIRGTGNEARGQVVVSWKTDEPATSQIAYAEGSTSTQFNLRTTEDAELTTEHIVIVSDLPTSKVYTLSPISKDKSGNVVKSVTKPVIIGRASDNVLDIVLNSLRKIFGI